MKKNSRSPRFLLSLLFAIGMLLFTFITLAWFSDRGFQIGFEIPVGTKSGAIGTIADLFWMLAPFSLIASVFLSALSERAQKFAPLVATSPLFFYALLELAPLALLWAENVSFPQIFTLGFLLLLGAVSFVSVFVPESRAIVSFLALSHLFLQIFLVIISFVFDEKYSWFYFSQIIPFGKYDSFRYSFFVISVFLYYLFHSSSLALLLLPPKKEPSPNEELPENEESEESSETEESEEAEKDADLSSLSLEDFGIER